MKKEDSNPHFVETNNPKTQPWRTDIFFGQRDGNRPHGHMAVSGATILYLRDEQGEEIIVDGSIIKHNL